MRQILDRMLGRAGNTEADVAADPHRVDSREPDGGYVGRVAPDDDFGGETAADRGGHEA